MEATNRYNRKRFHQICIVLMIALFIAMMIVMLLQNEVDDAAYLHTAGCGMVMVMDILLALSYSSGHYEVTEFQDRIYMAFLIFISTSLLLLGLCRLEFYGSEYQYLDPFLTRFSLIFSIAWISLVGVFDLTFFRLPMKRQLRIRSMILVVSALFTGLVMADHLTGILIGEVGPGGISPGPLFFLWWVYSLGTTVWYSVMILRFVEKRRIRIVLLTFEIHMPFWLVLDFLIDFQRNKYLSFTFLETFGSFLSVFLIFCFIYIENSRKLRENEMELTQSKLDALQLQMNPHFMANSLSALSALMDQDTKAAKRMIADMSGYLRDNFYDLSGRRNLMIPFPEELERLEHYLAIERIRFPDINVDYWLEVTEFEIPAMTLQPLVENAIKHGICKKSNYSEGNIEIRSSQTLEAYLVIIEDDGAGFDEKQLSMERKDEETKQHIGIRNTARRLELMCEGSLTIHSTQGRGTTCEITIPKQKV